MHSGVMQSLTYIMYLHKIQNVLDAVKGIQSVKSPAGTISKSSERPSLTNSRNLPLNTAQE